MLFHKREMEAPEGSDAAQTPQLKGGRTGVIVPQTPWPPGRGCQDGSENSSILSPTVSAEMGEAFPRWPGAWLKAP